jgi:small subunit ribosomal protein S6
MVDYELVVLLPTEEEGEKVKAIIKENQGKIEKEERLGEKKLAYKIKKFRQAFYYLYHLTFTDKKNVIKLQKSLNFNENIIRYLLLVKEK